MKLLNRFHKFWKLTSNKFRTGKRMFSIDTLIDDARNIFRFSVQAVQPGEIIQNSIQVKTNKIEIQGEEFLIDKNVYVVGFGKAVLGMAITLEHLLQNQLVSGILSVPVGLLDEKSRNNLASSSMKIYEGARNNMPDSDSLFAAKEIAKLVTSLRKSDILLVLISGGGSALLPSPKFPLTLEEKQEVIRILASKGATIEELNCIRKKLSDLKGGGLAYLTKPARVVSLILSDIIGDPIGLIASGPTVKNTDDPTLPSSILQKYKVKDILPQSAVKLIEDTPPENPMMTDNFDFVNNYVIGNNTMALNAAAEKATELGYTAFIMTNKLTGIASNVGVKIVQLVNASLLQDGDEVIRICVELNVEKEKGSMLLEETKESKSNKGICLLFGGETTVEVKGKGLGGRNQELALAGLLELRKRNSNVIMLSAGTDGIDGPTDAAGAIATHSLVEIAEKEGMDVESFLNNNDSYNFYNKLHNGTWHVKIGHTGTNVMDIIIVLIKNGDL